MSKIDLKNFVDIDIQKLTFKAVKGTRETLVLFTADTLSSYDEEVIVFNETSYHTKLVNKNNYESIFTGKENTLNYLNMFFNNGGVEVLVVCGISVANLVKTQTDAETETTTIVDDIFSHLDNKYIYVAYASDDEDIESNYSSLKNIAKYRNSKTNIYGINEKIILASTAIATDIENVKNFGVKYSTVQGAEMTIAAYFSKINVYKTDSVFDYAFTQENITEENISDETFKTILNNHMNVDIMLAETVRNCGGDDKNGEDLVNNFVRIVLHQTLTDNLIKLLVQKIKGSSGISKIYTVIAQELEKYLNNGYLSTDKIWTEEDLEIDGYTIIEKGTALTNGYIIKVLPFNALNSTEITNKSAPPIYIILADQYRIRKITIAGYVI